MAKIKLTKTAVEAAQPQAQAVELRDTVVPGFLCKITPAGRKVFMLQYRTNTGERRKPALGLFGELTVEQARVMAQDWLAEVRRGGDPGSARAEARKVPTVDALCKKFMEDYSSKRNKVSTQKGYQAVIDRNIVPLLGRKMVQDVKRPDIAGLMEKLAYKPAEANRTFGVLRKMFNMAEVWGFRPDGTNPCRHVPMFPAGKATRLINDEEMARIFRHLEHLEAEGLENYVIPLAIRLQFEFAGRRSEICGLEWDWIDLENRRVVWPDSKTGGMSKPLSEEAYRLLSTVPHREGCAGLEDGVDWHWDRVFAGAALTTLLGVGAELAAPENRQNGDRVIIAGRDSLQDSVNQAGQEMTRRNMNIQPTLTERPGLPVRIIVNRDLVLRPYQPLFFNRGTSR